LDFHLFHDISSNPAENDQASRFFDSMMKNVENDLHLKSEKEVIGSLVSKNRDLVIIPDSKSLSVVEWRKKLVQVVGQYLINNS
jgi:hypothetical protein